MNICQWHLCNSETKTKFCSTKCKNKFHVVKRRKVLKEQALTYMGGKCSICDYDKCTSALEFHHIDEKEKDFGISQDGNTRTWEEIKKELDKCVLLCANCHREVHAKLNSFIPQ
jgi:predicted HNH restriction endonuclease